jgi:nitrate/nitrite transporter NarK
VEYYIAHGEVFLTRLTWSQRVFKSHQYFAALAQEQFEAAKLARLVRAKGAPLIAALTRIAHGTIEPALAGRRRRLGEIADCAVGNQLVPLYSFHV